jgi:hypothetical protein
MIPSSAGNPGETPDAGTVGIEKGYHEIGVPLRSTFEGWTFGNILFGGLAGVAVDAGSGAMHDHPQSIEVSLIPGEFVPDATRDAFFDAQQSKQKRLADVEAEHARVIVAEQ